MSISDIVKINRRRWEIEESFMIMKSYILHFALEHC